MSVYEWHNIKLKSKLLLLIFVAVVLVLIFFLTLFELILLFLLLLILTFALVVNLSKHNNFILRLCVLPSTEDEQVRSDCCCCVTETTCWRITKVFSALPAHCVCRPYHKVIALFLSRLMLEPSAACLRPTTEHHNVRARNIHRVTEAMFRRSSTDTQSGPNVGFSVENSNVVEVAFLQCCALMLKPSFRHCFFIVMETTVDHKVSADENCTMAFTRAWTGARSIRFRPSHDLEI